MNRYRLGFVLIGVVVGILMSASAIMAQPGTGSGTGASGEVPFPDAVAPATKKGPVITDINPLSIIAGAGDAALGATGKPGGSPADIADAYGPPATNTANPTGNPGGLSTGINILVLLTVIGLAPSIMLMTTCFIRIVIVLGLLRQALGTNQLPPPQVIVGLSLFMTLLVMAPTIDRVNAEAIAPYRAGQITDYDTLWTKAKAPVRDFMLDQIEHTGNWSSLYMMMEHRGIDVSHPENLSRDDVDMVTLVPSFMLSELKTAFLMGFRVYLPFLVIDMVIASILISMNMMMLPPVLISLPFKLLLFVLVDGWQLVVGSLLSSFTGVQLGG